MSQVLERKRTEHRVPVRRRSRVVEVTLMTIGALVALVGVYFQFAPSSWWLAHFSEAYHLGSYILGGLTLAAGFGVFADRAMDEDGRASTRVTTGMVLAIIAGAGAVIAALVLTF
jgi:nitrate reductase gamma subunit